MKLKFAYCSGHGLIASNLRNIIYNHKVLLCLGFPFNNIFIHITTVRNYYTLSHEVASGSDITPCNKIDKPLVFYRFSNVM